MGTISRCVIFSYQTFTTAAICLQKFMFRYQKMLSPAPFITSYQPRVGLVHILSPLLQPGSNTVMPLLRHRSVTNSGSLGRSKHKQCGKRCRCRGDTQFKWTKTSHSCRERAYYHHDGNMRCHIVVLFVGFSFCRLSTWFIVGWMDGWMITWLVTGVLLFCLWSTDSKVVV